MKWFRISRRLTEDPQSTPAPLAAAIRGWRAEGGSSDAVARLERRLSSQIAAPVFASAQQPRPAWLVGFSMATGVALVVALCVAGSGSQPQPAKTSKLRPGAPSAVAVAGGAGIDARAIASLAPGAVVCAAMHHGFAR